MTFDEAIDTALAQMRAYAEQRRQERASALLVAQARLQIEADRITVAS